MSKYNLTEILQLGDESLVQTALELQIDPTSPDLKNKIIGELKKRKQLKDDYKFEFPEGWVPLSEIICNRLRYETILQKTRKDACSPLSGKIAKNLIRVGATRIFDDPERSFVEPIVNSIDAYKILDGQRPTGKFGIGFYSMIYWLIKYPGAELTIESNPIKPFESKAFTPYRATINTNLELKLEPMEPSDFRFRLTLKIPDSIIDSDNLMYVIYDPIKYVTTAEISIFFDMQGVDERKKIINEGNPNKISVTLIEAPVRPEQKKGVDQTFIFEDNATGVPIYLLGNILVPALSSKTIVAATIPYTPRVGSQTGFYMIPNYTPEMNILVGEISVVQIFGSEDHFPNVVIQLSGLTPLPVSRDDILISNRIVKEEFELNVFNLLDFALEKNSWLYPLALIEYFEMYPTGRYLVPIIKQKIVGKGFLFVPLKFFKYYQQITDRRLVGSRDILSIETENTLLKGKSGNETLFVGKSVYFLQDVENDISFGDSTRIVFLSQRFRKVSSSEKASWSLLFKEFSLLPVGTEWKSTKELQSSIEKTSSKFRNKKTIGNLIGRIYGLTTIFTPNSVNYVLNGFTEFLIINKDLDLEFLDKLVAAYFKLCGSFKPAVAYGSSMKTLYVNDTDINPGNNYISPDEKFQGFFLELFERLIAFCVEEDVLFIPTLDFSYFEEAIVEEALKLSENVIEYLYIAMIENDGVIKEVSQVSQMLDFWRNYLTSPERIKIMLKNLVFPKYLANMTFFKRDNKVVSSLIIKPSKIYADLMFKNKEALKRIGSVPALVRRDGSLYYLSGLLDAVFHDQSLEDLQDQRVDLPIQVLEIATNEGTTKPYIQAMITETFQNSVDARRSTRNKDPIKINLGRTGNLLSYSITDTVGIPPAGILSLSIPFLSSKIAGEGTGEIGSGFFVVYKNATIVNIHTVFDKVETIIVDQPLLSLGRVVDIDRNLEKKDTKKPNGTTITVYFNSTNPEEDLTAMISFCQNSLPLASDSVVLNEEALKIETHKVPDYNGRGVLTARSSSASFESMLLTNGVPFTTLLESSIGKNLGDYLKPFIATDLVIDLLSGFSPTQSRTKIRIENEKDLIIALYDAIYYRILELQLEKPDENYVQNFTSTAPANQILPPAGKSPFVDNLNDFLWYHIPGSPPHMIRYTNLHADPTGDINLANVVVPLFFGSSPVMGTSSPLQLRVGKMWIANKSLEKSKPGVDINFSTKGNVQVSFKEEALNFAKSFTNAFCKVLERKVPEVRIALFEDGTRGSFSPEEDIIRLSSTLVATTPPKELTADSILGYIEANASIYGKRFPAAVLIHELEHHRRNSEHTPDSHGNQTIDGKNMTFDECANYFYNQALRLNLISRIQQL